MAYLTRDYPYRELVVDEHRSFAGLSFCCERKRGRRSDKSVLYYFRGNTVIINACVHGWPVRSGHEWRVREYTYATVAKQRRERLAECFP